MQCDYCEAQKEKLGILAETKEAFWGMFGVLFFPMLLFWQWISMTSDQKHQTLVYHRQCEHVQSGLIWASGVLWGMLLVYATIQAIG